MNDEWWRIKDDDFKLLKGFALRLTDEQTDKQTFAIVKSLSRLKIFLSISLFRSLCCFLIVISLKIFPILDDNLHLSGTFYLYCGVVLCGLPLIMMILPETKDLSIHQINNLFKPKTLLKDDICQQEWN